MSKYSKLDRNTVYEVVNKHMGNIAAAARELGVPNSTLHDRYKILQSRITTVDDQIKEEQSKLNENETEHISYSNKDENTLDFVCLMRDKISAEEIAVKSGYDLKKWKVTEVKINQWQVAGKKRQGQEAETKRWLPDELWKEQLFQIKFKLERRAPKFIQDGVERLMNNWINPIKAPKIQRRKTLKSPHLLEISLFDAHFGKLAWAEESGADYDLKIAENIYLNAVDDLLTRSSIFDIERVLFPIGQDFFNVDNWKGETSNGTLVESTDDRFTKIFSVGVEAIKSSLMRCRDIAPVHVLWSPGNHDRSTSWYLCKTIQQFCIGSRITDITFDLGPNQRKYELYGNTLLGFTHSCDEKMIDLPLIMAREEKELWSKAEFHQWHVGHYHKKKEMRFIAGDTFNGVSVQILPSLTATDSYHYRNGWVCPTRAAEAYLWSKDRGLSNFMAHNI